MNIQKKLSKLGIEKIEQLNYKDINYIAHYVSNILTSTFIVLQDKYNEILSKILCCKMYYAKIEDGLASVDYIYEEDSIYIDENVNIFEPNEQLFHEVIHFLQVSKRKNGKIKKMGLCSFGDFSVKGLGINEAIVQYMSAKMMKNEAQITNIYGIKLKTISPKVYPMLTNLIEQLIYLLGEDILIKETLGIISEFEDEFYNTFEEKGNIIIKNFDKILDLKNELLSKDNQEKVAIEEEISNIYIDTQEIMMKKYFNNIVTRLTTIEEIDFYIEKFLNYKKIIGIKEQDKYLYDLYEQYKEEIMGKFDKQLMKISKEKGKNTLSVYNNKLGSFIKKILSQFWN